MKKKNIKRTLVCLGLVGSMALLGGCSNSVADRSNKLNENLLNEYNSQIVVDQDLTMYDFRLIGTEIEKNGFTFEVNFNGVSSFSDKSVNYTSFEYNVPSTYFSNLKKNSSTNELYSVFDKIVEDLKPENISSSPISNLAEVNGAFTSNLPQLFAGFKNERSLVLNLSSPEFNDEENQINFNVKTLVDIKAGNSDIGIGYGIGFSSGNVGIGMGPHFSSSTGTFIANDKYTINLSESEYHKMKENPSLIFDYCVKAIKEKDGSKFSAERESVSSVTYDNANLIKNFKVEKVSEEMGR